MLDGFTTMMTHSLKMQCRWRSNILAASFDDINAPSPGSTRLYTMIECMHHCIIINPSMAIKNVRLMCCISYLFQTMDRAMLWCYGVRQFGTIDPCQAGSTLWKLLPLSAATVQATRVGAGRRSSAAAGSSLSRLQALATRCTVYSVQCTVYSVGSLALTYHSQSHSPLALSAVSFSFLLSTLLSSGHPTTTVNNHEGLYQGHEAVRALHYAKIQANTPRTPHNLTTRVGMSKSACSESDSASVHDTNAV
jgi:hypothetical protein